MPKVRLVNYNEFTEVPSVRSEVKIAAPITKMVSWGSITAACEKALVVAVEPDIFVIV